MGLLEDHVEQGQHAVVQAFGAQPTHAGQCMARLEQLEHLVEKPRRGHVLNERGEFANRGERGRVDLEIELRRKPHRTQHAHRVLAIAGGRVADHAQSAGLEVGHATEIVEHLVADRVVIERVDGEVATQRVFMLRAEDIVAKHPTMLIGLGIGLQGAKGGGFDGLAPEHDMDDLEAPPDDAGAAKECLHFLGRGIGGDVEVFGLQPEQRVANAAADHEGLVAASLQNLAGFHGGRRNLLSAYAELGTAITQQFRPRCDRWFRRLRWRGGFAGAAPQKPLDELDDHGRSPLARKFMYCLRKA